MMYIFPRQFGLHNVFTSPVSPLETAQKFKDYTLREEEIQSAFPTNPDEPKPQFAKLPKRLRGDAEHMVQRFQVLHSRCSYIELLRYYCPAVFDRFNKVRKTRVRKLPRMMQRSSRSEPLRMTASQPPHTSRRPARHSIQAIQLLPLPQYKSLVDLATPSSQVSTFCQAVLSKIIPNAFWGDGETQIHNKAQVMLKVDHFIKLRRFETMSMHEVCQYLKVCLKDIHKWSFPNNCLRSTILVGFNHLEVKVRSSAKQTPQSAKKYFMSFYTTSSIPS